MARKILNGIDLAKGELQNARIQNLAVAPASPVEGQVYYDTTVHRYFVWNGTQWNPTDITFAAPGSSAVGDAAAAGASASAARADHTHGREAFGNVVAQTTFGAASSNGTATTEARADHTHGTPAAPAVPAAATTVTGSAIGDAGAVGVDTTYAREDHKHAREATQRLDQLAAPTAPVSFGSQRITSLADPSGAQDAATKNYVDVNIQGLAPKGSAAAATTAALPANTYANGASGVGATLTATANGALAAIDGYTAVAGDVLLVKNEATAANNGLYTVTQVGDGTHPYILTRATNLQTASEVTGAYVFVRNGTTNANQGWLVDSAGPYTIGTTAITFTQFSGVADITAGTGLQKTGNTLAIDTTWVGQTAITTLGIITTGTWNATAIAVANGGTGATTAAAARANLGAIGKYAAAIGDGATTAIAVTHNLGTRDVSVTIYDAATYAEVEADVVHTDANNVTITFATAPAANAYRVVVCG